MKLDVDCLKKTLAQLEKDNATVVVLSRDRVNSIERLIVEYKNIQETDIKIVISESASGGFNLITKTERF